MAYDPPSLAHIKRQTSHLRESIYHNQQPFATALLTYIWRLSCSPPLWRHLFWMDPILVYGHQTRFFLWQGTWTTTWRIRDT
jgi:hypothetical protein